MAEELEFYDVKSRQKFKATEYRVEERKGRFFAVTKSPSGDFECWKILGKEMAAKLKAQ